MILIPQRPEDLKNPQQVIDNLQKSDRLKVAGIKADERSRLLITIEINGHTYPVVVHPTEVQIPDFIRMGHTFSQEEFQKLAQACVGLAVSMDYVGDCQECFYDQLQIIHTMVPDLLAVMDCPSEKLLSGKWVALAAKSKVLPAPRYLFTVQAILGDNGEVWLHSHGLKRCGLYELEILCSTEKDYNDHYRIIENHAIRLLEAEKPFEPGEGVFLARMSQNDYLVTTAVPWKEALEYYPEATLGTSKDRDDEVHDEDTYVLMAYKSPMEERAKQYTKVQEFDALLNANPMFMVSTKETERMSALAAERISYMVRAAQNPDNRILLKIGLTIDKEHWNGDDPGTQREHIWFELKEVQGDSVVAELTQDPYYIAGLKKGAVGTYPFGAISDWLVFTKERRITADDAYLLDV